MKSPALAIAVALISADTAAGQEWFERTLPRCFEAGGSVEAVVEPLVSLGWQPVAPDEVSDAEVEELAMVYLARHAAGAAPPGLSEAYDQQQQIVRGILRKDDIPQSRSRFLRWRGEGGPVLMVAWRSNGVVTTECRIAFDDPGGRIAALAEEAHGRPLKDLGEVVHLDLRPTERPDGPGLALTLFDDALALPADVTMETFVSVPR